MATVQSYTKEYMQPILDATVIGAHLEPDGDLILEHQDSSETNAGNILPAMSSVLEAVYPVGSIYLSVVSTDPGTLFGGTWAAFGSGRMPIGVDGGDSRFDAAEETGGTDVIVDDMLPDHTHEIGGNSGSESGHTHAIGGNTGAEGAHTHGVNINSGTVSANHTHSIASLNLLKSGGSGANGDNGGDSVQQGATSGRYSASVSATGTTGTISANHFHNVNGNTGAGTSHTHSLPSDTGATSGHTHTMPTDTGSKNGLTGEPFLPPYIAVYMWKRTA